MLDLSTLQKFDTQGMYKIYDSWPQIARKQYETDFDGIDIGEISHVVFVGMGGSGAMGDIFSAILSKTNIHVEVIKGYLLPKTVDSKSLVVATSISGNTEETLSILNEAKKLNCKIIAFSSGGKMEDVCIKNGIDFRKISQYHSPRTSFSAFLFSMLKVLNQIIPLNDNDIQETLNELTNLKNTISSYNLTEKNPALNLANWISEIPLIYYPWGLQAVAVRFKNSLQENAKSHTMIENVIEASHNGIVSWEQPSIVKPIFIQGVDDHIKTKERWKILENYFKKNNIEFWKILSVEGNILTKLINLIYLLDYSTIYYAVLHKIDPSPVKSIDFIKNQMSEL